MKFKVGDVVKLVKADPLAAHKVGDVGVVFEDSSNQFSEDFGQQVLVRVGTLKQIVGAEFLELTHETD